MKLLAIDTSTEACSAALYVAGDIRERFQIAPREHAALILPMIDELLAEAGLSLSRLDALAFGRGPGSFTGVRIATGVVQGLAFGAELPVVPVSSLAALAQGVYREHNHPDVLAAIDARMGEVYWAAYRLDNSSHVALHGDELVCKPEKVPLPAIDTWIGAGSGWQAHSERLQQRLNGTIIGWLPDSYPHARDVAALGVVGVERGLAVTAEQALPVYLRDNVARKMGE